MGCMLRSDKMSLCDIYIQPEAAFEILSQLGEMGCVQFLDMNPEAQPYEKQYVADLCRCAEMERKLHFMTSEMEKDNMTILEVAKEPRALQPNEMLAFENIIEKWETDVMEMASNLVNLRKNFVELSEMYYVLQYISPFLGDVEERRESKAKYATPLAEMGLGGQLAIITGVVRRSRCFPFEMMLWRISRGNIYYRQATEDRMVNDPQTGQGIRKVAFIAICQGEALSQRMRKVCSGFGVNLYPCPKTYDERMDMMSKVGMRMVDLEQVIKKSNYHRCKALRVIRKQWHGWMISVKKAKAIYHNLNLFNLDITKNCLIGQCWVPDMDINQVQNSLVMVSQTICANVPSSFMIKKETTLVPPTYHRTNKFTRGFQVLINAYGESYYRELNPGLYTIVTFPFLFSMMFGDIGHGAILMLFGLWMVIEEKKLMEQRSTNEIWNIFFGGRYVILLMGIFSIYAGFIYNDCFSKPFNLFGSYWLGQHSVSELASAEYLDLDPLGVTRTVYVFGLDPVWLLSNNKIMVQNSIKMKLAIIFGIIHMIFGIVISLFDHILNKRSYAIFLEFIPQILFLMCLFLWLLFMIYYKWFNYGSKEAILTKGSFCAPQILILFIDMVLLSETKPLDPSCEAYMFAAQKTVQMSLVAVAVLCVPVLLFGTPLYLVMYNRRKRREALAKMGNFRRYQQHHRESSKNIEEAIMAEVVKYTTSFGELMIHQGVSTIEYVLSTVSHTASYLRLWALSLAHSELSDMLWHMVLANLALIDTSIVGCVKIFIIFAIWASFTISILVVMEGMSAFLHTLRLHWVEFMSKFYLGGGYLFKPFSFRSVLSGNEKTDNVCKMKAKRAE